MNEGRHYHCPPGPIGACQTSFDALTAHNLGFLTSHPSINEDGSITITYTGQAFLNIKKCTVYKRIIFCIEDQYKMELYFLFKSSLVSVVGGTFEPVPPFHIPLCSN